MLGEEEKVEPDDLDDPSEIEDEEVTPEVVSVDQESRRKLEDALEQRRLEKEIQDYDFDLD